MPEASLTIKAKRRW